MKSSSSGFHPHGQESRGLWDAPATCCPVHAHAGVIRSSSAHPLSMSRIVPSALGPARVASEHAVLVLNVTLLLACEVWSSPPWIQATSISLEPTWHQALQSPTTEVTLPSMPLRAAHEQRPVAQSSHPQLHLQAAGERSSFIHQHPQAGCLPYLLPHSWG